MKRDALEKLKRWKASSSRKPLLLRGARQVGKTWIMHEFGRECYAQTAVINFDKNEEMRTLFSAHKDPRTLLRGMELELGMSITPGDTLIILDEVQEAPQALASLKYFCEDTPEHHIIAAGSLLGVAEAHRGVSFPVGKVEFMQLHPLTFYEFLGALGQEKHAEALRQQDTALLTAFHSMYTRRLKEYFCVGGMPGVVADYAEHGDMHRVRERQKDILLAYEQDFSKHIQPTDTPKVRLIWDSLPAQLARENKKFIYSHLAQGARASTYGQALSWLLAAGLVHCVRRISKPGLPLLGYEDASAFKLFMLDTGLLCAKSKLPVRAVLEGDRVFEEFKGALAEQYVLQELTSLGDLTICYWTGATSEVDFVAQLEEKIVPIEVKAGGNTKAKSLAAYRQKYAPDIAVITSLLPYNSKPGLLGLPLYMIGSLAAQALGTRER